MAGKWLRDLITHILIGAWSTGQVIPYHDLILVVAFFLNVDIRCRHGFIMDSICCWMVYRNNVGAKA